MATRKIAKRMQQALEVMRSSADPLAALAAVKTLSETAEELEIAVIEQARQAGASWTRIGAVYGTTKQGAQQRFRTSVSRQERRSSTVPDPGTQASPSR